MNYNYKLFIEDAHAALEETGGDVEVYKAYSLSELKNIIPILEGMDKGLVWSTSEVWGGYMLFAEYKKIGVK